MTFYKGICLFVNCFLQQSLLFSQGRPSGGISKEKMQFAKDYKHIESLEEICREIKPTCAIGRSIHIVQIGCVKTAVDMQKLVIRYTVGTDTELPP